MCYSRTSRRIFVIYKCLQFGKCYFKVILIPRNMIETSELQLNIYWLQCEISASGKPIRISLPLVCALIAVKTWPLQGSLSLQVNNRFASIQCHNHWKVLPRVLSLEFWGFLCSPDLHSGRGFMFLSCAGHP